MSKLEKANAICSIGTFVLTAIIVVLMVWPAQQAPSSPPKGQPMIGWLMPSILAFCLILAGVLHLLAARTQHEPSPDRTHVVPDSVRMPVTSPLPLDTPNLEERIFVGPDITPQFLTNLLREHTEVQAAKLLDIYIGKWMALSGAVSHVGKFEYGSSTVMFSGQVLSSPTIVMLFGKAWTEALSVLRLGNNIKVIGRINSVDLLRIRLDDCELV
jgi:hypothetical protein